MILAYIDMVGPHEWNCQCVRCLGFDPGEEDRAILAAQQLLEFDEVPLLPDEYDNEDLDDLPF